MIKQLFAGQPGGEVRVAIESQAEDAPPKEAESPAAEDAPAAVDEVAEDAPAAVDA
jgi:hypothetical protein